MAFAIEPLEALKWIAVIFIAGFIGYFGKYLSKLILGRIHKTGPEGNKKSETPTKAGKTKEEMEYGLEKKRLKIEKKRIKALKKANEVNK